LKLKFRTVAEKTAKNFRGLLYFAAHGIATYSSVGFPVFGPLLLAQPVDGACHDTSTDGQTTYDSNTALCILRESGVKITLIRITRPRTGSADYLAYYLNAYIQFLAIVLIQ